MRLFTPYEQNQLKKHNISLDNAQKYGNKPVEYITGFAEFGGYEFIVTPNVLIPRVETAQMIDIAINYCSNAEQKYLISDVGCGCGNLGISLFLKLQKQSINS